MFTLDLKLAIAGMLGSAIALGSPPAMDSGWVQGSAVVAFIGFLIWCVRVLFGKLEDRDKTITTLHEAHKKEMKDALEESKETTKQLVTELKAMREIRKKQE
tara:strand:+ start:1167 stop:1472 length:306 start_codon:yes stop_codon:yes gene_type:complete